MSITQAELKRILDYRPATGVFTWHCAIRHGINAGDIAGAWSRGYIRIQVSGFAYFAHRLAWLYQTGEWPNGRIDHRDRCKANNTWANLRLATQSQNMLNVGIPSHNTSGVKGVSWNKTTEKWRAVGQVGGEATRLGDFAHLADAAQAYDTFAKTNHGAFYLPPARLAAEAGSVA